ncbi:NADPH-dependent F420 reductase [Azotobacter armeniacus]
MKIGILGSGRMGGNLGTIFARAGHDVSFSYSRSEQKLAELARQAGPGTRVATPGEAVEDADLVLLAVHWLQVDDVLSKAGSLAGKTVVSCCNPLNADDTELVIAHTMSGAETIARKLPESKVVSAFQATPSELLPHVFEARNRPNRPSLVFCGDDADSKAVVAQLIRQIGFDPVDAGSLKVARYIEPFGMLSAVLAYETDQGPEWAYRFGRFAPLIE